MGVRCPSYSQGHILNLGGHQSGPTTVFHIPRAAPENVLETLAVHHIPIPGIDEHHSSSLGGGVLHIIAGGLVLEECFQGLNNTWNKA